MKKIKVLLLAGILCLSMTACRSEDKTEEKNPSQEDAQENTGGADVEIPSQDTEEQDALPPAGEGYYTLSTEDGQKSIQVKIPDGYEPLEYSTETWLDFEIPGQDEQNSSQLIMTLLSKNEEEAVEIMKQEVQYTSSANATGEVVIEEIQTQTEASRQVSYFHYAYTTDEIKTEGFRFWTALENGSIFTCTIENRGSDAVPPDIESMIQNIIAGIQE